jgi:hypothetical protein
MHPVSILLGAFNKAAADGIEQAALALYEAYGEEGLQALEELLSQIPAEEIFDLEGVQKVAEDIGFSEEDSAELRQYDTLGRIIANSLLEEIQSRQDVSNAVRNALLELVVGE